MHLSIIYLYYLLNIYYKISFYLKMLQIIWNFYIFFCYERLNYPHRHLWKREQSTLWRLFSADSPTTWLLTSSSWSWTVSTLCARMRRQRSRRGCVGVLRARNWKRMCARKSDSIIHGGPGFHRRGYSFWEQTIAGWLKCGTTSAGGGAHGDGSE